MITKDKIITNNIWQVSTKSLTELKHKFVSEQKYISAHYIRHFEAHMLSNIELNIKEDDFNSKDYHIFLHYLNTIKIGIN